MLGAIFLAFKNATILGKHEKWRNWNHLQTVNSDEISAASLLNQHYLLRKKSDESRGILFHFTFPTFMADRLQQTQHTTTWEL